MSDRMTKVAALAAVTMLATSAAHAQWTGKGAAGISLSSGNTDTKTGNAAVEFADTVGSWKHVFGFDGLYAAADSATTAQRWDLYEQSDFNITPRNFVFGAARYEEDRFSGFQYQATVSTGLGRHFVATDSTKLTAAIGIGYKNFETRNVYDESGALIEPHGTDNQAIARGTLDFEQKLTSTTTLLNKFLVEAGSANTYFQNDLGLEVKMNTRLSLAVGYSVRHNTEPPMGFKKTDTLSTLNLVYEIKRP
jgi:putative salt-induced outer membrane protein